METNEEHRDYQKVTCQVDIPGDDSCIHSLRLLLAQAVALEKVKLARDGMKDQIRSWYEI